MTRAHGRLTIAAMSIKRSDHMAEEREGIQLIVEFALDRFQLACLAICKYERAS